MSTEKKALVVDDNPLIQLFPFVSPAESRAIIDLATKEVKKRIKKGHMGRLIHVSRIEGEYKRDEPKPYKNKAERKALKRLRVKILKSRRSS